MGMKVDTDKVEDILMVVFDAALDNFLHDCPTKDKDTQSMMLLCYQ